MIHPTLSAPAGPLLLLVCCGALGGCTGLAVPECVLVDENTGLLYVSNIDAAEGQYWADDGAGFISRLKADLSVEQLRWRDSTRRHPINAPKGMCIVDGVLWVADNRRVHRFPLDGDGVLPPFEVEGAQQLNDMATDDKSPFVSDTATGKVHRLDPAGRKIIKGPPGVNGITFLGPKMFAVSWDLHEVYELDPTGKEEPRPFGLASHFVNLDGIEVLDDGTFIVSDFTGNKICSISPDRKTVTKLLDVESPADIGLDRRNGILYIPQFMKDKVVMLKLSTPKGIARVKESGAR